MPARLRLLCLLTPLVLVACSDSGVESVDDAEFQAQSLAGVTLYFENPSPNTQIGEQRYWKYHFSPTSGVRACNALAQFVATEWFQAGALNSAVVNFGNTTTGSVQEREAQLGFAEYELYFFYDISGGAANGDLEGSFDVETDVNFASGSFTQSTQWNTNVFDCTLP